MRPRSRAPWCHPTNTVNNCVRQLSVGLPQGQQRDCSEDSCYCCTHLIYVHWRVWGCCCCRCMSS